MAPSPHPPSPQPPAPPRIESPMSNWFGTAKRGQAAPRMRDVQIMRGGRTYTASWHVEDGKLLVSSAYGSRVEPVGRRRDLAGRATVLLGEIVEASDGRA